MQNFRLDNEELKMTESQEVIEDDKIFIVDSEEEVEVEREKMAQNPDNPESLAMLGQKPDVAKDEDRDGQHRAPEGGWLAWAVVVCSFLCNGIIFSIINSFGSIFNALKDEYDKVGDPDAAAKASIIGSVATGAVFAMSPVSGILSDRFGIRPTSFFGGFMATAGLLISSFFIDQLPVISFTYGVMFGVGASLVYTPSLAILGHYFQRRIGLVNGLASAGSSIFTIIMPHLLKHLIADLGIPATIRILAGMTSLLMVASLFFKSLMVPVVRPGDNQGSLLSRIVYYDNWKKPKYIVWCLAVPAALFGYFIPYVHIGKYVKDTLDREGTILVTCIAGTSLCGRLAFGKLLDYQWAKGIPLQQMALVSIGLCTMFLVPAQFFGPLAFPAMILACLILGVFDGCFITMFGPIAFEICGPQGASQGIGFILGMCSLPLSLGPPIAGIMYDHIGNYNAAFVVAGLPPILGAACMCAIHRVGTKKAQEFMVEDVEDDPLPAEPINGPDGKPIIRHSITASTFLEPEL